MKPTRSKNLFARRLLLWLPVALLLWLGLLLGCALPQPPLPTLSNQPLLIHNVQLVNVVTGDIVPGQSVWIEQGKIQRITTTANDFAADPATGNWHQINGNNQYLIPGLQDMHTHSMQLAPQLQHPLWLAAGVTSVRDMSGCMAASDSFVACSADRKRWQQQLQQGVRSSPRYPLQSSFALNGGAEVPDGMPAFLKLQSAADAKALVEYYQQLGVDQLKIYEQLSLQQFQWLAAAVTENAAKPTGITLAGHQPWLVPLENAIEGGLKSLEHGRVFLFECSTAIGPYKAQPIREGLITALVWQQILDSQDEQLCQQKMQLLAASDSWWSPTLLTLQLGAKAMLPQFRADPRLNTVPWLLRILWQADADAMAERGRIVDEQGNAQYPQQQAFALALQHVQMAQQLGVKIIAGTDAPDSFVFTGSGLHDELALYVQAGFTPLQALQTATLNAARYHGTSDRSGQIAVGFDADLVLLAANPLTDIQALRQVQGLVIAGQWYDQDRLMQLQQFAIGQAGSLRINLQLMSGALQSATFRQQFAD
ncbi:amidohydrolase family protein [Rheinheimera riviphila]|nr:amidohydrolase family protein [Rheinheimera riviphila]